MKNIISTILAACVLSLIPVNCSPSSDANTLSHRAAQACGNTSLAVTFYEAFEPTTIQHAFNTMGSFVLFNTQFAPDTVWQIHKPSFNAWRSPGQPGTVPLNAFFNPTTADLIYLISTTPPPGYSPVSIPCFVYPTQVCGSVPLYAVAGPGDHWYTIEESERDEILNNSAWSDAGIAAYVLPPSW